ncbi:winged helix-turn-helix transcriptional regulator [Nocardia cyriacigeorgica]|uniref:winged helix-turn-helix transcriptional regulator n=1 Tax=Nocardia cyriacigeorgica TaxID=135487 RepID=UPI002454C7EA|nr:winged helix-turn-helix transcriptional regulator [Nocardia cyriacigeorgica]
MVVSDMRSYGDPCGVARALDVIGERWAVLVVRNLLLGPKRFNDLLGGLPGVSPNVLSQRLRELVEHGVVQRRELEPPARVRLYELTEWGHALEPILLELGRWGSQAPISPDGALGVDSLLLSVKAAFDSTRAAERRGIYELRIDADTYTVEVADAAVRISHASAPAPPDATLATDLDTLRAVCDHRTTIDGAVRSGTLRLDGTEHSTQNLTSLLLAPFSPQPTAEPSRGSR